MLSVKKPLAILVTGLTNSNPAIGDMYYKDGLKMLNSLKKTNPDIEKKADIKLYTDKDAVRNGFTLLPNDLKMRYMTPIFTKELLKEYRENLDVVRIPCKNLKQSRKLVFDPFKQLGNEEGFVLDLGKFKCFQEELPDSIKRMGL